VDREPLQAGLERSDDAISTGFARIALVGVEELGRQYRLVASTAQCLPQELLGVAFAEVGRNAVFLRSVEKGDAGVEGGIDYVGHGRLVATRTEEVGAEVVAADAHD
jgi:hypothetical protein